MSKQPWMKFFPSDWRADPALRSCGFAARGLWIEMLAIMHEAVPRGHLLINSRAVTNRQLAAVVGGEEAEVSALLSELERAGVYSRKKNGTIFSRRMEKEENRSRKNRENGKNGGNPSLCNKTENDSSVNRKDNPYIPEARSQIPEDITPVPPLGETAPTKIEPRKSPSRGARIPDDWQVGPEELAAAQAAGLPADRVAIEGDKFRDYWRAKTGQGATKADWPATWRNWCRRAAENIGRFPPKPPDKPRNRGGFATILQENMDDLLRNFNDEQPQHYPDDDWRAEPEITPPGGTEPRGFAAGGQDLRRDEDRADGLSNVFDFRQARAYG